ncbi:hypothetical protein GCM10012280_16910 [Wenjunlia tyrosinilytica]|uniref:Uncharacterized protein n=1 Tax=Wenjunlia tyrosinilytica TaxID=1544741 RepID=A0A917ZM90_9ACTN|nr:hypothetical protein GCM10012280_16910 [Wenjunlia tyrosinilytica]
MRFDVHVPPALSLRPYIPRPVPPPAPARRLAVAAVLAPGLAPVLVPPRRPVTSSTSWTAS